MKLIVGVGVHCFIVNLNGSNIQILHSNIVLVKSYEKTLASSHSNLDPHDDVNHFHKNPIRPQLTSSHSILRYVKGKAILQSVTYCIP